MSNVVVEEVSLEEVKRGLADGSIALIDVREPNEWAAGHIAGATLNPLSSFDVSALPNIPGKRVVFHCRSGKRTLQALAMAQNNGRPDVKVFGGSQGAKVMADIVPGAIERLEPHLQIRLVVVQQAREEDLPRVRAAYARLQIKAEVAPFFSDLPARIAAAHLVVSRSGASTVAELAAIGRPAILVPLPHALDQDQAANAAVLERAGAALRLRQEEFTPDRLAADITQLATAPQKLVAMAEAARSQGSTGAAERLADLVIRTMQGQAP